MNRVYDLGRYARTLQYDAPIPETTSLTPEDRAWVEFQSGHVEQRDG